MRQGNADALLSWPAALWWLAGLLLFYQLPHLPNSLHLLWLLPLMLAGLARPGWRKPALLGLALLWAWQDAHTRLNQRLPEGPPMRVQLEVEVLGLPHRNEQGSRFDARILAGPRAGQRLRLYWYPPAPPLAAGERWRLNLRLRPVSGTFNPGGFDFERWAFQQRVVATGRVENGRLLGRAPRLDAWRDTLSARLQQLTAPEPGKALLRALLVGDKRGLSDAQWESLAATGTGHLMAISGLHLGLLAAWTFWLVRGLVARFRLPCRWLPAREWALLTTLPVTLAYALAAGFSLPTRRAWLMLALFVAARLLLRRFSLWQILGAAAVLLTLADPPQVLSAGFWLSFVAVAVLALASGDLPGASGRWKQALRAQLAISLAMIPLGLFWFGRASLLALPVNLLLIPLTGWLLLPLGLVGLLLLPVWPTAAETVLSWDAHLLGWMQRALDLLASLPGMQWQLPTAGWPWLFSLAALLLVLKLRPRRWPQQAGLVLLLLMPLWQAAVSRMGPQPVLSLWVLDVGQGLSAVLQTEGRTLVYDSGPSFRSGGSMSERVLLPFLRWLGVSRVDVHVASHADDDHAGGSRALLRALPVARFHTSAGERFPAARPCLRGQGWQWGAVSFRFLYPRPGQPYLGNDSSCVLLVAWRGHRLLLPGDAGSTVEWVLLRKNPALFPLDVLLPGHHGSQTASSPAFVRRARARHAVFAAGRHNRFGFPKPEVVARFRQAGSELHHTGLQGAVRLALYPDGRWQVDHWRQRARLWNRPLLSVAD